jgi:hypothetical protein
MITYPAESSGTEFSDYREQESRSGVGDLVCRGTDQVREMVQNQPTRVLFGACLIGMGIGLMIGKSLSRPAGTTGRHWLDRDAAEQFAQHLIERVNKAVPKKVRGRLFHK